MADDVAPETPNVASSARYSAVRQWVIEHDDRWLFILPYIGLAVGLSALISLFWLGVVVLMHVALECFRQRQLGAEGYAGRVLWNVKLDLALFVFSIALTLYLDHLIGAVGIGAATRATMKVGAHGVRATSLAKAIQGIVMSLDDLIQLGRVGISRLRPRNQRTATAQSENPALRPWKKWSAGDHLAVWMAAASITLILLAPWLLPNSSGMEVFANVGAALHPWPS